MMIVTQRIATIKNAEQIIVLDEGKIAGMGTHNELMKD
jgi:ATP-binding cassette subfamily B protein